MGIGNVHFEWTNYIGSVPLGILFILGLSSQPFKPSFRHLCAAEAMENNFIKAWDLVFSPRVHYNSLELVLCASCYFGVLCYKELLYCLLPCTMHHLGSAVTSRVLLHSSWLIICRIKFSPNKEKSWSTVIERDSGMFTLLRRCSTSSSLYLCEVIVSVAIVLFQWEINKQ